ncbi:MAG: hypothetical protein AB7S77_01425 [Desulfatirhabdiaceae bacterium]
MKTYTRCLCSVILLLVYFASVSNAETALPADPGWPRLFEKNGRQLIVHQPQIDVWRDYRELRFRCAIAVKTGTNKNEMLGVLEASAETETDLATRIVTVISSHREMRFPNTTDAESALLHSVVDELLPPGQIVSLSLDRIIAYLDPDQQPLQQAVDVNLEPPKIFYSGKPAILVIFLGEPRLQPVQPDKMDMMFAVNTNWDVFYDTVGQRYYLLNGSAWLTTPDLIAGPWTPAGKLPAALTSLPADDNWADVRQQIPGKQDKNPPVVFVSTEPAELLLTKGEPGYSPISGTKLMRVSNTDIPLFLCLDDKHFYVLIAGRWFRSASLDGPWVAASNNLPQDFSRIPDTDPAAFVKASVPGTVDAGDAVLLASIPSTTAVDMSTPPIVAVDYSGEPKFQPIQGTTVQYAVNTPTSVFLVDGGYYCCNQGVWFCGAAASGPWTYCSSVPPAIYTIPASHPAHNVTYVVVQSSTPTTVVYSQTAGYSGEYVAATGVLMFGAGMIVGAMIADNHNDYYYPPYPVHYSYGCGASYSYAHGGYYRTSSVAYGPYGGAGAAASYNPNTGNYQRGAYAYGPAGSASVRQAYNPNTGARATSARVDTAYGSAGRFSAYNPSTGTAARGGYRSSDYGSAAAVQTNRGTGAAAWDTQRSEGAVVRGKNNVYAGKDGNVYKKDNSGNWSSNSGSGWETVDKPQPNRAATTSASAYSDNRTQAQESRQAAGTTAQSRQSSASTYSDNRARTQESRQAAGTTAESRQSSASTYGGNRAQTQESRQAAGTTAQSRQSSASTYSGSRAQTQESRQTAGTTAQSRPSSADRSSRESVQSLESSASSRQRGNQMSQRTSSAQTSSMSSGSTRSGGSGRSGGGGGGGRSSGGGGGGGARRSR